MGEIGHRVLLRLLQRCLRWSEVALHEALSRLQNAASSETRDAWEETLKLLLTGIDT